MDRMYLFKVQPVLLKDRLKRGMLNSAIVAATIGDDAIKTIRCLPGVERKAALSVECVGVALEHVAPGVVDASWNA